MCNAPHPLLEFVDVSQLTMSQRVGLAEITLFNRKFAEKDGRNDLHKSVAELGWTAAVKYERGNYSPADHSYVQLYKREAPTQCRFVASRRPSRRLLVTSRGDVSGEGLGGRLPKRVCGGGVASCGGMHVV